MLTLRTIFLVLLYSASTSCEHCTWKIDGVTRSDIREVLPFIQADDMLVNVTRQIQELALINFPAENAVCKTIHNFY